MAKRDFWQTALGQGDKIPLRIPQLTTAERDQVTTSPGMTIFNTDQNITQIYNGLEWLDYANSKMGTAWSLVNANFTARAGYRYIVDMTTTAFSMTLPTNPQIGDEVEIKIIDNAGVNTTRFLNVLRNGQAIQGVEQNRLLNVTMPGSLLFVGGSRGWTIRGPMDPDRAGNNSTSTRAVAIGSNGNVMMTDPIVSAQTYVIDTVLQTPASTTWSIRLQTVPTTVPSMLTVRADAAMNGLTYRTHPIEGTWMVVQSPTNPCIFELVSSVYQANCYFVKAHCYVPGSLINASVQLNNLAAWARANGPSVIQLPMGGMYVQTATVRFPESCTVIGRGGQNTFFFFADRVDHGSTQVNNVLGSGVATSDSALSFANIGNARWVGFSVFGNRTRQTYLSGQHAVSLGSASDPSVPLNISWEDVHIFGSAGYGTSGGNGNSKIDCWFENCSWIFSDGDCFDFKNHTDINNNCNFINCDFGWHAMGDQGTNLAPILTLPANTITSYVGQTYITIPRNNGDSDRVITLAGDVGTIANASNVGGINPNGSWNIIAVSSGSNTITMETNQTATSSATGGGSLATFVAPHISLSDTIVDFRGIGFRVKTATWRGMMYGRNGFRDRQGVSGIGNGLGAVDCTFEDLKGVDLTPAWVGALPIGGGQSFISLNGLRPSVSNVRYSSVGGSFGLIVGSTGKDGNVSDIIITGGRIGMDIRGHDCKFSDITLIDQTFKGVQIYGADISALIALPNNPFNAVSLGSNVINVFQPEHGVSPGGTVYFTGQVNANGLTLRTVNSPPGYVATVIDDDNFTIVATGSATSVAGYGGTNCSLIFPPAPNYADNNQFLRVTTRQTGANSSVGWSIGKSIAGTGRARNVTMSHCRDEGSNLHYEDFGDTTIWTVGNTGGLPNYGMFDTVNAPGLTSSAWVLQREWTYSNEGGTVQFTGLGAYQEVMIQFYNLVHNSGISANWSVQVTADNGATWKATSGDYGRFGTPAGTDSLVFCGSVSPGVAAGGLVRFTAFNMPKLSSAEISGGLLNGATGVQTSPGYVTAPVAFSGFRLLIGSGSGQITGGYAQVWVKQGAS